MYLCLTEFKITVETLQITELHCHSCLLLSRHMCTTNVYCVISHVRNSLHFFSPVCLLPYICGFSIHCLSPVCSARSCMLQSTSVAANSGWKCQVKHVISRQLPCCDDWFTEIVNYIITLLHFPLHSYSSNLWWQKTCSTVKYTLSCGRTWCHVAVVFIAEKMSHLWCGLCR